MKNTLQYYYNLTPEIVLKQKNFFYFVVNNIKYYFVIYERPMDDIKSLYELNKNMIKQNLLVHEIIQNKDNNVITIINNTPYVLLKIIIDEKKIINLYEINYLHYYTNISSANRNLVRLDWVNLWSDKLDYFEYQINQIGKKYPILCDSLSYFIGMGESAIAYVNQANYENNNTKEDMNFKISHKRIKRNYTMFSLYNPLNYIIDSRVRDISEYIKDSIISNINPWNEIIEYFQNNQYTLYEWKLLYGRLFFPTYYFDIYEDIVNNDKLEKEIIQIISNIDKYENFLYEFYEFSRLYVIIPRIEWIRKKVNQ